MGNVVQTPGLPSTTPITAVMRTWCRRLKDPGMYQITRSRLTGSVNATGVLSCGTPRRDVVDRLEAADLIVFKVDGLREVAELTQKGFDAMR